MKNIRVFYLKNFSFLEVKFSIYLNRHVFVMYFNVSFIHVKRHRLKMKLGEDGTNQYQKMKCMPV